MNREKAWWIVGVVVILAIVGFYFVRSAPHVGELTVISSDGRFSEEDCLARGFGEYVIMFESKYCGHCQSTLPVFLEACEEKGIDPIVVDLAEVEGQEKMQEHSLQILYTPTFVYGCDYYIGGQTKEGYLELIDKYLGE